MNNSPHYLLAVNAGSSSIKLSAFTMTPTEKAYEATVANIGQTSARLTIGNTTKPTDAKNHIEATNILIRWLMDQLSLEAVVAVGHRLVHGGPNYHAPQPVTQQLMTDLQKLTAFDPNHLPVELQLIELFGDILPKAKQVACFDTAFHHDLPTAARLLPIPRNLTEKGIRRYGFHGLSYASILEQLRSVEGEAAANGKVVIAHLGSGASMAALRGGKSIDTTMSMTPASGIPMSTRSGDLDPGIALYLANTEGYDAERFNRMVNTEAGLLGISGTTADMEKLLNIEQEDARAKEAVDVFCYQAKKSIGSLAAALGGLNTLVFTGGMGEHAPKIRTRICEGLEFLGISLDETRNDAGDRLISKDGASVGVHVIHTDEAATIARETFTSIQQDEETL